MRFLQEWRFCFCCITTNITSSSLCTCSGKRDKSLNDAQQSAGGASCRDSGARSGYLYADKWEWFTLKCTGVFFSCIYVDTWAAQENWNMSAAPQACEFKRLLGLWAVSNACASRCYYAAAETEEGPRAAGSSHIWHRIINSLDSCSGTWPFDRSSFHRTHGSNPLLPAETNLYPEAATSRAHLDYHSIYNCSFRILYLDECCCG